MNVAEAARRLQLSKVAVQKACDTRRLRCHRDAANHRVIDPVSVEEFAKVRAERRAGEQKANCASPSTSSHVPPIDDLNPSSNDAELEALPTVVAARASVASANMQLAQVLACARADRERARVEAARIQEERLRAEAAEASARAQAELELQQRAENARVNADSERAAASATESAREQRKKHDARRRAATARIFAEISRVDAAAGPACSQIEHAVADSASDERAQVTGEIVGRFLEMTHPILGPVAEPALREALSVLSEAELGDERTVLIAMKVTSDAGRKFLCDRLATEIERLGASPSLIEHGMALLTG